MLIGSMGGRAITRPEQGYLTFLCGIAAVTLLQIIISYLCLKSDVIRRFVNGEPIIVISKGQISKYNLRKARLSMNELASLLRSRGIFRLSDVEYAIFESTRDFSVMLKSERSPLTLRHMNIEPDDNELPVLVIKDGKLIVRELKRYNLTENWINEQLARNNIHNISEVLLAQANSKEIIYICLYNTQNHTK
jgi:uncharacterized membrane protein YcaP (DUF421 family)